MNGVNSNGTWDQTGMPLMYQIREDVKTKDQRAKLLYAWLQMDEEFMPEIFIPNVNYKGNMDRPDFMFGSDGLVAEYSWKNVPIFEDFKKVLFANKETAVCVASVDSSDSERVGMFDMDGQMGLTVYADKMLRRHDKVFNRLYEVYDKLDIE